MKRLSVFQLDTNFPRFKGDVASRQTYSEDINIIKIDKSTVSKITQKAPQKSELVKFEHYVKHSREEVLTTSCGFLFYWQDHLQKLTKSRFISSSLCSLDHYRQIYPESEILIFTYNAENLLAMLNTVLKKPFKGYVLGLNKLQTLYRVITSDLNNCDYNKASYEVCRQLSDYLVGKNIKLLVLECTNLVPFKTSFKDFFSGEIVDILSLINNELPGILANES